MSVPLTVNGAIFNYPEVGDENWGTDATQWAQAVTTGMLQKAGGLFQLQSDVNFGNTYGLVSNYFKSRTANISDAGVLRMARPDVITWRNQANNGNNTLSVNSSNELLYNGLPIASSLTVANTPTIDLDITGNELTANLVSLGAGENGYVLIWDNGTTSWVPGPIDAGGTLDGDVSGPIENTVAESLTGLAGTVSVKAPNLTFINSITPTITQATLNAAATNAQTLLIKAQTTTGTASKGGILDLDSGAGTLDDGYVRIKNAGTPVAYFGPNSFTFAGNINAPIITQQSATGGGGGGTPGDVMSVQGRFLYDPEGNRFLMRGAEGWFGPTSQTQPNTFVDWIATLGCNAFRPQVVNSGDVGPTFLAAYETMLERFAFHKIVVFANNDQMSGAGSGKGPDSWFGFPTTRALLQSPEYASHMIVDVSIEDDVFVDDNPATALEQIETWVEESKVLIQRFRDWGYTCPLTIGTMDHGRYVKGLLLGGEELVAFDKAINPNNSLVLNFQMYWGDYIGFQWQTNNDYDDGIPGYGQALDDIVAFPHYIQIGTENADTGGGDAQVFYEYTMEQALLRDLGWLFWEAKDPDFDNVNDLFVPQSPGDYDPDLSALGTNVAITLPGGFQSAVKYTTPGAGGGGEEAEQANGNNLVIIPQAGAINGGHLHVCGADGYEVDGSVKIFNGSSLNAVFSPNVVKYYKGQAYSTTIVSANYTILQSDTIIGLSNLSSNITLTLPATDLSLGQSYIIKDMDGSLEDFTATIDAGANTIDNAGDYVMNVTNGSVTISLIDIDEWFTVGGGGGGSSVPAVSNDDHIFLTETNEVGFTKSDHKHFLYEDFETCPRTTLDVTGSSGMTPLRFSNTNWMGGSYETAGEVGPLGSSESHPGVVRLASGPSGPGPQVSWITQGDYDEGGNYFPYYVADFYEAEAIFKTVETENYQFMFGLADEAVPSLAGCDNAVAFFKNSGSDATVHALCRNSDTSTNVDTNYNPSALWTKYTIRQETLGTFTFHINDVLKNTITTNIPSDNLLSLYISIQTTNTGGPAKTLDIDYCHVKTRDLGDRFEEPSEDITFVSFASGAGSPLSFEVTAGSNRLLVVGVSRTGATGLGSTAAYDGYAMNVASNSNDYAQMFYLLNPTVGTANITVTSGSIGRIMVAQYNNVSSFQESAQGDVQTFGFTTSVQAVIPFASSNGANGDPLAGMTTRYDDDGTGSYYAEMITVGGGSVTVGTSDASGPSAAAAVFLGFS